MDTSFVFPIDALEKGSNFSVVLRKTTNRDEMELEFSPITYRDIAAYSKYLRDTKLAELNKNKQQIGDQSFALLINRYAVASMDEFSDLIGSIFGWFWAVERAFNKVSSNKAKLGSKSLQDILTYDEIETISNRLFVISGLLPADVLISPNVNPQMPKTPTDIE